MLRICSLLSLHPYFGMLLPVLKAMARDCPPDSTRFALTRCIDGGVYQVPLTRGHHVLWYAQLRTCRRELVADAHRLLNVLQLPCQRIIFVGQHELDPHQGLLWIELFGIREFKSSSATECMLIGPQRMWLIRFGPPGVSRTVPCKY